MARKYKIEPKLTIYYIQSSGSRTSQVYNTSQGWKYLAQRYMCLREKPSALCKNFSIDFLLVRKFCHHFKDWNRIFAVVNTEAMGAEHRAGIIYSKLINVLTT